MTPTLHTHKRNSSDYTTTEAGWKWSEMTWRARFTLLGLIAIGAALVLGVLIIAADLDEDSLIRSFLLGILLAPIGTAAIATRSIQKAQKASRANTATSLRSGVMRWLILIAVLAIGVITIALAGSLMGN